MVLLLLRFLLREKRSAGFMLSSDHSPSAATLTSLKCFPPNPWKLKFLSGDLLFFPVVLSFGLATRKAPFPPGDLERVLKTVKYFPQCKFSSSRFHHTNEYYEFLTFQNWFFYFLLLLFSSVSDKIFDFSASSHRLEKEHLIWSISFAVVSIKYDVEQMDSDLNCIVSLLMYSLSFYQDIYNLKRPPLRTARSFETKEKQGYRKLNDFNNFFLRLIRLLLNRISK